MLAIRRHWAMEFPREWMATLRDLSPVSSVVPWLEPRWFPFLRTHENGRKEDAGRWVLYECVPETLIPDTQRDIVELLSGPPPSWIAAHPQQFKTHSQAEREAAVRMMFADNWQCRMYRQHRVWPRVVWVIQGDHGGHAVEYEMVEQQLLRLKGLPTEPPAVGDLPYAPFDERVCRQMRSRNRLIQFGNNLDALRKSGDPRVIDAEWKEQQKAYRAEYCKYLVEQQAACVEFLTDYSRTTECRNTIPEMTREQRNAAAIAKDMYIETGDVPYVAA